jgi:hypothetical protein
LVELGFLLLEGLALLLRIMLGFRLGCCATTSRACCISTRSFASSCP